MGRVVSPLGGRLRGYLARAGGKEEELAIDESIDGGCTLSHGNRTETVTINKRTPDRSGGIKSIVDRIPNQCDCRPGGGTEIREVDRYQGDSWNLW